MTAAMPPRVDFEPQLVEDAVHLLARADGARWESYRARLDPLYDRPDRDVAIPRALLELFAAWGAAEPIVEGLRGLAVARVLVARSQRPGDEGAELFVGPERTVLLRLPVESFADRESLGRFLRHELRHVSDMLDPAFGYERDLGTSGRTRAEQELVRGRYRVLWNLAIDRTEPSPVPPDVREREFDRAFAALSREQRLRLAARFGDPSLRTHAAILAAARDPWGFLGEKRLGGPAKGQPCPLCGFPTHDWDEEPPGEAILGDFPAWTREQGACRQCSDIYRVLQANGCPTGRA